MAEMNPENRQIVPRTMVRWLGVVLGLWLAWTLVRAAEVIVAACITSFLSKTLPGLSVTRLPRDLGAGLGRVAMLAAVLLPFRVWPELAAVRARPFRWTWTLLISFPFVLANVLSALGRAGADHWSHGVYLAWDGMATGVIEEIVFRGFLFYRAPRRHPRWVVLVTTLAFTFAHHSFFQEMPAGEAIVRMVLAGWLGLGLGIERAAGAGLGWLGLLHGLFDVGYNFGGRMQASGTWAVLFLLLILVPPWLVLWLHPCFRGVRGEAPGAAPLLLEPAPAGRGRFQGLALGLFYLSAFVLIYTVANDGLAGGVLSLSGRWLAPGSAPAEVLRAHFGPMLVLVGMDVAVCGFYLRAAIRRSGTADGPVGWMVTALYQAVMTSVAIWWFPYRFNYHGARVPDWTLSAVGMVLSCWPVVRALTARLWPNQALQPTARAATRKL